MAAARAHDTMRVVTQANPNSVKARQRIAATEAANSAVSGANLIPVLSLGIPGNAAAVFLILATESISGFNVKVFKFTSYTVNLNWSRPLAFLP